MRTQRLQLEPLVVSIVLVDLEEGSGDFFSSAKGLLCETGEEEGSSFSLCFHFPSLHVCPCKLLLLLLLFWIEAAS